MTIKETYLKMLMTKHILEKSHSDAGWSYRLEYFILNILNGIKALNKKDLTMKEFSNLDYMITLTKESNNNEMKDLYLNLPGMKNDFSYHKETEQQYMFLTMTGKHYNEQKKSITLNDNKYHFRFKADTKSFNIKMTYGYESFYSRDIEHLISMKDYIIENDVQGESFMYGVKKALGLSSKRNFLEDISEQVKMINY